MTTPSFSSFPPSFDSFPDLAEPGPSEPRREKESKKHRHDSKHSKSKHKEKERKERKHDRVEQRFEEDAYSNQRIFFSDRKGDPLNVQYGRLHKGDIPRYSDKYSKKILGLSPEWSIFYRSDKGIQVGKGHRKEVTDLASKEARRLLFNTSTRRIRGSETRYQEVDGYIRIASREGSKAQDYRSITREDDHSDSDASLKSDRGTPESSDEESDDYVLTSEQEALKSLEQQLSSDPTSVDTWLRLLSRTLSTVDITTKNATRARSEITLSLLARAMSADPCNATSKRLQLKYLRAGAVVWDNDKLRSEWENALKLEDVDIWVEWLEWQISIRKDGIDGVFDAAERILRSLGSSEEEEVGKVRVFWRVAVACQQAGYPERATAMFQAQAELLFEMHRSSYGLPFENCLDSFEEFWESESPRVGEPGSKGWANWISSQQDQNMVASTSTQLRRAHDENLDPYEAWALEEFSADQTLRLPTRSMDDSSDLDPYSTVLFADIRNILLSLRSQRAKDIFRLAWLAVLGLPVTGTSTLLVSHDGSWDDRWNSTYVSSPSFIDSIFPSAEEKRASGVDSVAGVLVGRQKHYANSFGPVKNWSWGVIEPLDPLFGSTGLWSRADVKDLDHEFISRVFSQLRLGSDDWEWDILALAFAAATNLSRSFLSDARDSLPHWAAHGQLERMRGREDDARKVYQTVLIASSSLSVRPGESRLWWEWAEMEWLSGSTERALSVIMAATKTEGRAGVSILRAKRTIQDAVREEQPWKDRESWIKLIALLDLLTNDISSAVAVFDEELGFLKPGSVAHESMTVALLLFLYRYGTVLKNPLPPSILRDRVHEAIGHYGSNSIIIALVLECEKGLGVWGRVRGMLSEKNEEIKDVARRVQDVWIARWEGGRWEEEIERTRSGLERAMESERTRGSPILWRICIEFEVRARRLDIAKRLLQRAIGECPLSKGLYLMAFGALRSVFTASELNDIGDVMAERSIRMRKGLDEAVGQWKEVVAEDGPEHSELDEIEYNARELKRLKPY
ncbi:hypothetical protein D9758_000403 [Tetrapyrgos nigripes]|uniref:Uncharacterized protein n=1 Tax=Tetrapyrgos nigripes TaxID=182062 RepID=A0A8H5H0N3_9AGAR|nr:hypothetical protein D9758_000403 [Tetrapyrgos nigripes]